MNKLFRLTCCLAFAFAPLASARAQLVSPWFRGTAQSWKTLTETSFSAARLSGAKLSTPLSGISTGYAVKTTVPNWLKHRLSHSNTFSRMEKEIFTVHPANPAAVTGKLTFFSDRDALLAANAAEGEINSLAFARHQELLRNTLAEVEDFSRGQIAGQIHNSVFHQEELARLLKDPSQPAAFVLTRREVEQFPALSLTEQQSFAQNTWRQTTLRMAELLSQNPQVITTQNYAEYYYLKLRQRYFATLCQVLARAQTPRKTIIVRVHKKIALDFLPDNAAALTDAQRLGKLHFDLGLLQANAKSAMPELVALKAEIARQTELYQPYAVAEAFGLPYEQVLKHSVYHANIYFNEEEAQAINLLTSQQTVNELPGKIARIQAKRQELLAGKTLSPEGYVHYYRLTAQEEFLQSRLARAKFFLQYLP